MQAAKQTPNACCRRVQSLPLSTDSRGRVARRKRRYTPADVGVPAIVMHEMRVGAYKSQRTEHNLGAMDNLREFVRLTGLTTVDWAA